MEQITLDLDELSHQAEQNNQDKEILEWLNKLEQMNKFNLILVSETGSRSKYVQTGNSDFDLKGFYVFKKENEYYLPHLKCKRDKIQIKGKSYDIDYTLYSIQEWIENRVPQQLKDSILSSKQYINLFKQIGSDYQLKQIMGVHLFHSLGLLKSMYYKFIKDCKKIKVKRYLAICIQIIEYTYLKYSLSFQSYDTNIWKLLQIAQNYFQTIQQKKMVQLIKKLQTLIYELYQLKIQSNTQEIDVNLVDPLVLKTLDIYVNESQKEIERESDQFYEILQQSKVKILEILEDQKK